MASPPSSRPSSSSCSLSSSSGSRTVRVPIQEEEARRTSTRRSGARLNKSRQDDTVRRAERVISSACRSTQAEVTLANPLHIHTHQARVRRMEVCFDNDHEVWYLEPHFTASTRRAAATPPSSQTRKSLERKGAAPGVEEHRISFGNSTDENNATSVVPRAGNKNVFSFAAAAGRVASGEGGGPAQALESGVDSERRTDVQGGEHADDGGVPLPDGTEAPADDGLMAGADTSRQEPHRVRACTGLPLEVAETDRCAWDKRTSAGCDMRPAIDGPPDEELNKGAGGQRPGVGLEEGEVVQQKTEGFAPTAEQGEPCAFLGESTAPVPRREVPIDNTITVAAEGGKVGKNEGVQSQEARGTKSGVRNVARSPSSSCGRRHDSLGNKPYTDRSAAPDRADPGDAIGDTTPDASAASGELTKMPLQCREEGDMAATMTWRGQPVSLTEPLVLTLTESFLCKPRREQEAGDGDCRKHGEEMDGRRRRRRQRVRRPSRSTTSSGESDGSSASRKGDTPKPGRRDAAHGYGGGSTREAKSRGGSKHESSSSEEQTAQERFWRVADDAGNGRDAGTKHAPPRRKPHRRSGEEDLPLSPRSSARPAVFLTEPYFGPPIAELPRAWPKETSTMADPADKSHRRRRGRGSSICRKGE